MPKAAIQTGAVENKASRLMNPGSAGILPALFSRISHPLEFIISWTTTRNGYSPKTVRSSHGKIKLDTPRDRDGNFEPELIKKYQRNIVHVMRNSLKYVSHDDMQEFSSDAKSIYKAPTEEAALLALDGRGGVRNIRLQ